MKHRIRIIKYCFHGKDSTEFSLETTVDENLEELSKALENAFGSLRSFNAEMAKQEDAKTPIFRGETSTEGEKVPDKEVIVKRGEISGVLEQGTVVKIED